MPPCFLADEDVNSKIVAGLLRREPAIDLETARGAGILGFGDPEVLAVAAREDRILISNDRDTMPAHFKDFIAKSPSPGVFLISQRLPIREAIEQILLIWAASESDDWRNRIWFLPF